MRGSNSKPLFAVRFYVVDRTGFVRSPPQPGRSGVFAAADSLQPALRRASALVAVRNSDPVNAALGLAYQLRPVLGPQ